MIQSRARAPGHPCHSHQEGATIPPQRVHHPDLSRWGEFRGSCCCWQRNDPC